MKESKCHLCSALLGLWRRSYEKVKCLYRCERFKEGHEDVEDDEGNGRPRSQRTDENVEKMKSLLPSVRLLKYQSYSCTTKFRQGNSYVRRMGPEFRPTHWIHHYDNAPVHKALSVRQLLAQKLITEMEHPPYFPHLASNDFWLFPKIKFALEGRRFHDIEAIQ